MKKLNWKNVTILLLTASNLLIVQASQKENLKHQKEAAALRSELYFLEIEAGAYNEYPAGETLRNPMTGEVVEVSK